MLERLLILIGIIILILLLYLRRGGEIPEINIQKLENPIKNQVKKSDQFMINKYQTPMYTPDYLKDAVGLPSATRQTMISKEQLKRNILAEIRGSQAFNQMNLPDLNNMDPQMQAVNAAMTHIPGEMEKYIKQLGQQTTNPSINLSSDLKSEIAKLFGNNINSSLAQTAAGQTATKTAGQTATKTAGQTATKTAGQTAAAENNKYTDPNGLYKTSIGKTCSTGYIPITSWSDCAAANSALKLNATPILPDSDHTLPEANKNDWSYGCINTDFVDATNARGSIFFSSNKNSTATAVKDGNQRILCKTTTAAQTATKTAAQTAAAGQTGANVQTLKKPAAVRPISITTSNGTVSADAPECPTPPPLTPNCCPNASYTVTYTNAKPDVTFVLKSGQTFVLAASSVNYTSKTVGNAYTYTVTNIDRQPNKKGYIIFNVCVFATPGAENKQTCTANYTTSTNYCQYTIHFVPASD